MVGEVLGVAFLYRSIVRLIFQVSGICFCLQQWVKNNRRSLWNRGGIFFSMVLGILSGPGIFPFVRFFRHILYVAWSRYVCKGVEASPLFSIVYPLRSCH